MIVCAHGDVAEFCRDREMFICETWSGELRDYRGKCRVVVTAQEMSENEYYFLKGEFLARGIELVSTHHKDDKLVVGYLAYAEDRRKEKKGTRQPFGFRKENGKVVACPESIVVVRKILELRDKGFSLRTISENEMVRNPDGTQMSISKIQNIIKNRKIYE